MRYKVPFLIFFPILFIFLFSIEVKSQPNTLYFMKGIPQTKDLNPARPGIEEGFYLSMPGFSKLDLSVNTNNWSYSDLIHRDKRYLYDVGLDNVVHNGQETDSLVLDLERFSSAIGNSNFINESAGFTFLEGGFKSGNYFFGLSFSEKEFSEFFFHKNLIKLINYGNYPYIGTSFNSKGFGINAQHYRELAFNFSKEVDKKTTMGITAKILFGMGAIHTNKMNFTVASPPTGNYLDVRASGRAEISAPLQFNYDPSGDLSSVTDNFDLGNYLTNYGNPGFAMDFGIAYQANKKLELSASLVDVGMISWKTNTTQFSENGQYRYRGVMFSDPSLPLITDLTDIINEIGDSLNNEFNPRHSGRGFSTFLPVKLYLGSEYSLNENVSLAGLARLRAFNNFLRASFTTSANVLIGKGISLTGSYSIMESTFDNLGAGVGFRGGPFQVYAASDNIFSPFYPSKAKNMNLRVGINFIFDKQPKESKGKSSKRINKECGCPY